LLGKSLQMGNPMPRFNLTLNMTPAITSKVCQDETGCPRKQNPKNQVLILKDL